MGRVETISVEGLWPQHIDLPARVAKILSVSVARNKTTLLQEWETKVVVSE